MHHKTTREFCSTVISDRLRYLIQGGKKNLIFRLGRIADDALFAKVLMLMEAANYKYERKLPGVQVRCRCISMKY